MVKRPSNSDQFAHAENSGKSLLVQLFLVTVLAWTYVSVHGTTYERDESIMVAAPVECPLQPLEK